jgi:hypothetical protein
MSFVKCHTQAEPARRNSTAAKPPQVLFDAAVLYMLCRLGGWPGLSAAAIEVGRQALLGAKLDEQASKFFELAASGMPDAVVPFRRDELDVACAALMSQIITPCELGSDGMLVNAGFFKLRSHEVTYVDEAQEGLSQDTRLMDPSRIHSLLHQLRTRSTRPARYWVPGVDPAVHGDHAENHEVLRVVGPWVAPSLASVTAPKVTLRILRPENPSRGALPLCEVECVQRQSDLVLPRLRPEWLMELQAAALDGAWLEMEHSTFRCRGPLPDLLEPGDGRDIWWHPVGPLREAMGTLPLASVQLDVSTASCIVKHVPWAWIHRASQHFIAATGAPCP